MSDPMKIVSADMKSISELFSDYMGIIYVHTFSHVEVEHRCEDGDAILAVAVPLAAALEPDVRPVLVEVDVEHGGGVGEAGREGHEVELDRPHVGGEELLPTELSSASDKYVKYYTHCSTPVFDRIWARNCI